MKKYPVSPLLLANWTDDTPSHHHFVETQIATLINPHVNQFHDDEVPFLVSKGNCPFYDVMFVDGRLFEIKITGAIRPFVEYMHNGEDSGLAITKAEYYVILSPGFCKKEHQYAVQHEGNWYNGKINIVRVDALKRFIDYYNKTGNIRHVSKGQSVGYEILIRKMDDAIWFGNCPITLNNNPSTGSFVDEFDLTQIEYNTNFSIKQVDKAANKIF